METTACVALGSNLGEPAATLDRAAGRMNGIIPGVRLAARSRIWLTAPQVLHKFEYPLPEALKERGGQAGEYPSGTSALPEVPNSRSDSASGGSGRETAGTCAPGVSWYANMVVRLECGPGVTPESLFDALMGLEAELGRNRIMETRWGPRVIDIDLLTFGDETRNSRRLTLPHPRMLERAFVVLPLAEAAPGLVSPDILKRLSFSSSGTMIF